MNARNMATQPTRSSGCGCRQTSGGGCACGGACGCDSRCCELECLVRPNFFCGQLLTDADLAAMVEWTRKRLSLARYRDGWGIACGLDLSCSDPGGSAACCDDTNGGPAIYLNSGYAIDCCGNDLVVCEPMRVDLSSMCTAPDDPCAAPSKPAATSSMPASAPASTPAAAASGLTGVEGQPTEGQPTENQTSCFDIDPAGLYAVQVSLRYHEDLSHGTRAMFRGSCSDEGACEYSRVLEAPCVYLEEIPLLPSDNGEREEDAWTVDFRNYLRREIANLRTLLDKDLDEVARFIARNPPYQMCFLQEMVCCVRDQLAVSPQANKRAASTRELTTIGMYLLIDRMLRHLQCACGVCKPDTGVPIGRVLMRRSVVAGKTRCKVVAIDPGLGHRRMLRKDACRPITEGRIDLLPYLWQTPADAQTHMRSLGVSFQAMPVSMDVKRFDEPMNLLVNQILSIERSGGGQLIAHTLPDPFRDARIAAFSLAT